MSAQRFHVLLSAFRWPTLVDTVNHYLYRSDIHYESIESPTKEKAAYFALFNERGRIGQFLVRSKAGRLAFGYLESKE